MNFYLWNELFNRNISLYVFLAGLLILLISEASQPFGSTEERVRDMVVGRDTFDRNLLIWGTQLALGNS